MQIKIPAKRLILETVEEQEDEMLVRDYLWDSRQYNYVCACIVVVALNLTLGREDMHKKECCIIVTKNNLCFFILISHFSSAVLGLVIQVCLLCEDCKLAAPLGFFRGVGPRFRVLRRRHSCGCVMFWL